MKGGHSYDDFAALLVEAQVVASVFVAFATPKRLTEPTEARQTCWRRR
ncbi:hypothetical protein PF003_g39690 [Phytophthora fragariae]|nr:hypothetical protein PF003_g39690 [Phytophthora fragariae]